jgi:hypothetical protein
MEFLSLQSNQLAGRIPGELGLMTNLGEYLNTIGIGRFVACGILTLCISPPLSRNVESRRKQIDWYDSESLEPLKAQQAVPLQESAEWTVI